MNRAMTAPVLEPVGEGRVALQSVNVEAYIENLLCEVTINQVYSNLEKINIEAVYTFPLPLGAVLLDMSIKTKTKELKGVVIKKTEAEERYEDAVTDGDTAIMLEQVDPGLYTMNIGNLQPEDTVEISITYAELFKWRGNSLRFFLPTTIAPRYGDPGSIDVQPHQTPEYDLTSENPFALTLSILGSLAGAAIDSPSHKIVSESRDGKTVVFLKKGQALMDRDFVLNLVMEADEKSSAHLEPDGDGHVALASFYPKFPSMPDHASRCITIILDCSSSMGGDSIAQARKALYEILELLRPEDTFNVLCFGSSYRMLFPAPVPANSGNLKKAKNLLEVLDADMGGTEIGQAVAAAIKGETPGNVSKEALLITDGEVWDWEKVTAMAAKSGFRFFTVGVGSSVSEAFVQTLADATGGACELVSPHEDMAEKIVRHFKRIYFPRAEDVKISWPCESDKVFPAQMGNIYDGDTLHVFGRFQNKPDGNVTLTAKLENGEIFTQRLPIRETSFSETMTDLPGTTVRMAAACELKDLSDSKEIAALGVKYQLMTQHTNYLAIDVKADDEKAGDLPALRKTPQMLAAGWGGGGTVVHDARFDAVYDIDEVNYNLHKITNSYDSPQLPPVTEKLEDTAYKRTIEKLLDEVRDLSEQSKEEHKEFLEHLSRQLHQQLRKLQEKLFAVQADKIAQLVDKVESQRKEISIEKIEEYLRSSINDHLKSVSKVFRDELQEYESIVLQFGHELFNRLKNLIEEVPPFGGPVNYNKWVEFGKALERHYKLSGSGSPTLLSVKELQTFGVPDDMASFLKGLIRGKDTELVIACAFLYVLLRHPIEFLLSRETKRIIQKQYKDITPSERLCITISDHLIPKNRK